METDSRVTELCEAIVEAISANGEFNVHTSGYSLRELREMALVLLARDDDDADDAGDEAVLVRLVETDNTLEIHLTPEGLVYIDQASGNTSDLTMIRHLFRYYTDRGCAWIDPKQVGMVAGHVFGYAVLTTETGAFMAARSAYWNHMYALDNMISRLRFSGLVLFVGLTLDSITHKP